MAWFYEIRNSNNTLLKRDGGFATQDAAKCAVRADAKKNQECLAPRYAECWNDDGWTEC
jgi:hypothetical protein